MTGSEPLDALRYAAILYGRLQKHTKSDAAIDIWTSLVGHYEYKDAIQGIRQYYSKNIHKDMPNFHEIAAEIDTYVSENRSSDRSAEFHADPLEEAVKNAPTPVDQLIGRTYLSAIREMFERGERLESAVISGRLEALAEVNPEAAAIARHHQIKYWADPESTVF